MARVGGGVLREEGGRSRYTLAAMGYGFDLASPLKFHRINNQVVAPHVGHAALACCLIDLRSFRGQNRDPPHHVHALVDLRAHAFCRRSVT